MTSRPHDALFKSAFEHPERAAGLLQSVVPPSLRDVIAWTTLKPEDGSFIDRHLEDRHSDRLFSVELTSGRPAMIYVLLEHQSTNDPDMPLRMLACMLRIWERFRKSNNPSRRSVGENGRLPAIIPVLLSHALGGWTAPCRFQELFDPEVVDNPDFMQFLPDYRLQVEDLMHRSDVELLSSSLPSVQKVALWFLRDGRDLERLLESLDAWASTLDEAAQAPDAEILSRYIWLILDEFSWSQFRAKLQKVAPKAEEAVMTLAELYVQKGRVEGRVEGQVEGQVKGQVNMLTKLLALKFGELPPQVRARMEDATLDELDTWAERVLRATTLDEVFAS